MWFKTIVTLSIAAMAIPVVTRAENDSPPAASRSSGHVLSVGLKGGVGLPQLASTLDTTFTVHLEMAYQFPIWESRLGLITAVGYSQPTASGSGEDLRLPAGTYTWEMTQRQITWDIGLLVKVRPRTSPWNLGICAGSRLMFLSTLTNGESGDAEFGEHDEQATVPGLFAAIQAEYTLGPGSLVAEVVFSTAFQSLRTTGELALAELGILAGYRFAFSL